jgi:hypothetical protein
MQGASFLFTVKSKSRRKFTPEEDDLIRELVSRYGDPRYAPWAEIAAQLPDRSPRQVRERFQHYLSPRVSGGPWSREEDDLLRALQGKFGNTWATIAKWMRGRTNIAVRNRWRIIKDRHLQRAKGGVEEPEPEPDLIGPEGFGINLSSECDEAGLASDDDGYLGPMG